MAAMFAVAEKGYAATTVADILRGAKVSRTTFYELFDDKLDCFLAACAMASETVVAEMAATLDASREIEDPFDRLGLLLEAYLRALSRLPELARVFLVEVYAAGEAAIRQRIAMLDRFADLVVGAWGDSGGLLGRGEYQRLAAEMLVGAVSSKVTNAVAIGEAERLPELHEPMMALVAEMVGAEPTRARGAVH